MTYIHHCPYYSRLSPSLTPNRLQYRLKELADLKLMPPHLDAKCLVPR